MRPPITCSATSPSTRVITSYKLQMSSKTRSPRRFHLAGSSAVIAAHHDQAGRCRFEAEAITASATIALSLGTKGVRGSALLLAQSDTPRFELGAALDERRSAAA